MPEGVGRIIYSCSEYIEIMDTRTQVAQYNCQWPLGDCTQRVALFNNTSTCKNCGYVPTPVEVNCALIFIIYYFEGLVVMPYDPM